MKTELVIFDLAGTTVKDLNIVPGALVKAFQHEGITITLADANLVMGIPKPVAIKQLLTKGGISDSNSTTELIESIHRNFLKEIIHFYKTSPDVFETEGVTETFKRLKNEKMKIGLNTGFDRQTTDVLLSRLSWQKDNLIDAVVTSDEVENGRPFPDMIYKLMELTDIKDPASVVKVGDTASDLLEGNAAHCGMVIGITTGAYSEADLMKIPHSFLIKNIPDLPPLLNIIST